MEEGNNPTCSCEWLCFLFLFSEGTHVITNIYIQGKKDKNHANKSYHEKLLFSGHDNKQHLIQISGEKDK